MNEKANIRSGLDKVAQNIRLQLFVDIKLPSPLHQMVFGFQLSLMYLLYFSHHEFYDLLYDHLGCFVGTPTSESIIVILTKLVLYPMFLAKN